MAPAKQKAALSATLLGRTFLTATHHSYSYNADKVKISRRIHHLFISLLSALQGSHKHGARAKALIDQRAAILTAALR